MLERLFPRGLQDPDFVTAIERAGTMPPEGDALSELVGCCVWDVVSHNHKVLDDHGAEISLGSFRVAGEAIAEFASQHAPDSPGWNYMDFYLGTRWPRPPADVAPMYQAIYEVIFTRMRAAGFSWEYYAPEAQVMQISEPNTGVSSAVAALQRALDEAYTKAAGSADDPPPLLAAYHAVYRGS